MNELLKTIHDQVRIVAAIKNIERNITITYMESVVTFVLAIFVFGAATTISIVEYPRLCLAGYAIGIFGFCLSGCFVIGAYQIKKKLNLLLDEVAQDRREDK